jgi:hypothetical protein
MEDFRRVKILMLTLMSMMQLDDSRAGKSGGFAPRRRTRAVVGTAQVGGKAAVPPPPADAAATTCFAPLRGSSAGVTSGQHLHVCYKLFGW